MSESSEIWRFRTITFPCFGFRLKIVPKFKLTEVGRPFLMKSNRHCAGPMIPYYDLYLIPECRELKLVGLFSCSYQLNLNERFDDNRTLGSGRGPFQGNAAHFL